MMIMTVLEHTRWR